MDTISIRILEPSDSVAELTRLLHRAYASLGERGMNFNGVDQPEEVTAERVQQGICLVATAGERLVGTLLVHGPFRTAPSAFLMREDVACFQQFGVDPEWRSYGIGSMLLAQAEALAADAGYRHLSFDTALAATEVIAYYENRGYTPVEEMQWPGKNYRSIIMSKPLAPVPPEP